MKILLVLTLLLSSSAFALELTCTGNGENFTISASADKISVTGGYGDLDRNTDDQDCGYRSKRFACYEDGGQLMINIPLALSNGSRKQGTVYIQSDTDDNVGRGNHAQLGAPYSCSASE